MTGHIVDIYGEIHTPEERTRIENLIRSNHKTIPYDYLLSEEMGPNVIFSNVGKEQAIRNENFNGSSRSLELAIELDIPIIGIDLWDKEVYKNDTDTNKVTSFKLREENMVKVIKEYKAKGNCAVIIGDTHLRRSKTKMLGDPSKIYTTFKNSKGVNIYRSLDKEID